MVFHVGIDGFYGYIAAYNDTTKEIIQFKAAAESYYYEDESINKMHEICKKIQATLSEEFGYACIYLPEYFTDNFRTEFINNVKQIGFKNVFIINSLTGMYIECLINLKEKPKVGDIFWIFVWKKLVIWEKREKKSKIIQFWPNFFKEDITESDLLFYKGDSGFVKNPDIIFLNSNYHQDYSEAVKTIFPDCKYIPYSSTSNSCEIALLKARIAADDQDIDAEIKNCDINNFTENKTEIYVVSLSAYPFEYRILYLEAGQPLPLEKTLIIPVKSNQNILKLRCNALQRFYYPRIKITPEILNVGEIRFNFHIDENFIVSYDFAVVKTVENTHRRVKNFYANQIKSEPTYNIPQKILAKNLNIDAVGIDLGMTRCCVAVNRNDRFELVAIDNSERQLPSYVSFKEKDPICGQLVINQLESYANASVFDIKRIIGRNFDEIEINSCWPFEVIKNNNSKPLLRVQSCEGNIQKHPEEISAILLKHIKQRAEDFQGKVMDEVVITIPAGFNMDQKIATHVAADLAGFKTVHLLEEPIAASIAYFVDRPIPPDFNLLLFDLGGGTLDLCIFKVEKNIFKVIANDGDSNLGGRDFDDVLFQHFEKFLEAKYKIIMNEKSKYRLMLKCVEIKHALSNVNETSLDVGEFNPNIDEYINMKRQELQEMVESKKSFDIEDYKIDEFLRMTRHEFEQICIPVLNRIHNVFIQIFSKTKLTPADINKVLLVGGGCRMPMIAPLLRKKFPKAEHSSDENPDGMVAIGAAYYSSFLASKTDS